MTLDQALPLPDLAGRVAVVTGGGRGIGRAVAADLAAAGARVAVVARSTDQLAQAVRDITERGGVATAFEADLAVLRTGRELVGRIEAEVGSPDVLINNAGVVAPLGPTESLAGEAIEAALRLNVVVPVTLTNALIPAMRSRRWGRIVNVSSGIVANPAGMIGGNIYAASKAALEAHSVNLAAELAGTGISVNVYRPGRVDTAMQEWIRGQDPEHVGGGLVQRFIASYEGDELITPGASARALVTRLGGEDTGRIWSVDDIPNAR